jgi:hypothetical protein
MGGNVIAILGPIWAALGLAIVVYGIRAQHDHGALVRGCIAAGLLWIGGGALVNGAILALGGTYSGFADGAYVAFVHDTWESLVVPHQTVFIGLLIAFEATAGTLVLVEGPLRRIALWALIGFNLCLLSFGWGFYLWSVPVGSGLALLLRAEKRRAAGIGALLQPVTRSRL